MSKQGEVIPASGQTSLLPAKGLLHALSEIQFLSRGEKQAGDYDPEMLVTLTVLYSFVWEGFFVSAIPLIFSFFSLPLGIATIKNFFPAFGTYEHGFVDLLLIFLLSISPSALKMFFVAYIISQCYLGKTTKRIINWFVIYSIIPTVLLLSIFLFFIYQFLYFFLLSDANILKFAIFLKTYVVHQYEIVKKILYVLFSIKTAIPESSFLLLFCAFLEILFLLAAYFYADLKTKKYKKFLAKWGIKKDTTT